MAAAAPRSVFGKLLDKVLGGTSTALTDEECAELVEKLEAITKDDERDREERNAAALLLSSLAARRARANL